MLTEEEATDLEEKENCDDASQPQITNEEDHHQWSNTGANLEEFNCSKTNNISNLCCSLLASTNQQPIDFFNLFVDNEILDIIVLRTNLYAEQAILDGILHETITPNSRLQNWSNTNADEIRVFLGITLWMRLNKRPSIGDYWSKSLLYHNEVSSFMSRNRYELLLKFLHFSNNEDCEPDNRIYKIQNLIEVLNNKFMSLYDPGEKITIEESLPFRGRLKFSQFKMYKVCLINGYTWFVKVSAEKEPKDDIILNLMEPLLDSGRILYTDNSYTSVELAKKLLARKTHLIGTLKNYRKYNPAGVTKAKLLGGEMKALQSVQKLVVAKWRDRKDVLFLTTKIIPKMVEFTNKKGDTQIKPSTIIDYNNVKGYIDTSDQFSSYNNLRRGVKWYRKIALDLLTNIATFNAYKIFLLVTNNKNSLSITKFRESIAYELLQKSVSNKNPSPGIRRLAENCVTHNLVKNMTIRGRCRVCYERLVKESDRNVAVKKSRKVFTSCSGCPDRRYVCTECFLERHDHYLKQK